MLRIPLPARPVPSALRLPPRALQVGQDLLRAVRDGALSTPNKGGNPGYNAPDKAARIEQVWFDICAPASSNCMMVKKAPSEGRPDPVQSTRRDSRV